MVCWKSENNFEWREGKKRQVIFNSRFYFTKKWSATEVKIGLLKFGKRGNEFWDFSCNLKWQFNNFETAIELENMKNGNKNFKIKIENSLQKYLPCFTFESTSNRRT